MSPLSICHLAASLSFYFISVAGNISLSPTVILNSIPIVD